MAKGFLVNGSTPSSHRAAWFEVVIITDDDPDLLQDEFAEPFCELIPENIIGSVEIDATDPTSASAAIEWLLSGGSCWTPGAGLPC